VSWAMWYTLYLSIWAMESDAISVYSVLQLSFMNLSRRSIASKFVWEKVIEEIRNRIPKMGFCTNDVKIWVISITWFDEHVPNIRAKTQMSAPQLTDVGFGLTDVGFGFVQYFSRVRL